MCIYKELNIMKRIVGLESAYTPMTKEEQAVCVKGLTRIANGNTQGEDIRHFAGKGNGPNCKRWKPSREYIMATSVSIRIVYIEYDDRIQVIDMEARSDETYANATRKMRQYLASGMK
jgi:hypothetical protein